MCDFCVINHVKQRMLDTADKASAAGRRRFMSSLAGGAVAAGAASLSAPLMAQPAQRVVDLTHELHPDFPTYFGQSGFAMTQQFKFEDNGFNLFTYNMNEHTGTHIDAPLHFSADGLSVSEIPVENLVVPLCIIDIAARAAEDADTQLTPDDIKAWIAANGEIPDNACIAMYSAWAARVDGPEYRNADQDGKQHYPGFHIEATQMLLEETTAAGLAVDTLSLDYGISEDYATHYAWLPANRWGVENMSNLDQLPASGATLVVGAPKHRGGTGGPSRILALV